MILPIALPFLVLLFLVLVVVLIVMVELRILAYAYRKIGVRPRYVFAVLVLSLVGSYINIPLYAVPVRGLVTPETVTIYGRTYLVPPPIEAGATVVAINVVGADVLNLGRIAELGAPMISIGGAGTFDGVFLTGIIAGLLA